MTSSSTPNSRSDSPSRIGWVDYAKGICMIGVVTLYAANRLHSGGGSGWLQVWADFAKPFRMPDFFLLSGLFLGRVIDRPWKDYLDKKALHYLYFFFLWSVIFFLTRTVVASIRPSLADEGEGTLLYKLVEPYAMLWFIELLPVFFILTRLLRNVPTWVVLPLAALLQMFVPAAGLPTLVAQFCARFVFFYVGYRFASHIFDLAAWAQAKRRPATVALLAWIALNAFIVFRTGTNLPGTTLVLGIIGAMGVITAAALLMSVRGTDWLRYLGERSLVIYLGFYPPMLAFLALGGRYAKGLDKGTLGLLASALSALSALTLYWMTRNNAFSFLFSRPRWAKLTPAKAREDKPGMPILSPEEA